MMKAVPTAVAAALLSFCACGGASSTQAPWLSYPGMESHTRWLPLMGTAHEPSLTGPVQCSSCHPGSSFARSQVDCTTCHTAAATDPLHVSIPEAARYAQLTGKDKCLACHPTGQAGLTDAAHHSFFPVGPGSKHNRACSACHSDPLDRKNLAKLQCVTCHADPAKFPGFDTKHARVLDYPANAPSPIWCLRCHDSGQVDLIGAHGRQAGAAGQGGPGDGNHDTHCFQCHTMVPPSAPFNGTGPGLASRPWAQDWKQSACSACHNGRAGN
jgi:hypothetical protein